MSKTETGVAAGFDFDPSELRAKYLAERDKRLRPQGDKQYIELTGEFAAFAADPYADPGFTRAPVDRETDVVILGAGITGLMTAASLRDAGIDDFLMLDKAADFGGTWYWNRYPGVRCDVESYIYMPLLEELGYVPTEKYSKGSEILEHCRAIGRHFGLYERACFQTQVTSVTWSDASMRWIVKTDRGDTIRTRFITLGTGPISKPKLPGIPGIRDFKGHAFHTARWDYEYTGGNQEGGLSGLADKRVAVIGTGATGVQVIPFVAAYAKQTLVIQRTPAAPDLRNNRPTDSAWAASLEAGWQRRRVENFSAVLIGKETEVDLVGDMWTDVSRRLSKWSGADSGFEHMDHGELAQMADFQKMEEIRARIDDVVKDPATAEALKPWYNLFCKRPLYSDDYLPVFNLPSVKLVDTQGSGVERVTEDAIVVNGTAYPVDCIIFASGYDIAVPTYKAGNFAVTGRGGVTLEQKWSAGMRTLHGMLVDDFPNMFLIGTIKQAAAAINFPHMLGEQSRHTALLIKKAIDRGHTSIEVRPAAVDAWLDTLAESAIDLDQYDADCTPGYINNEGAKDAGPSLFVATFGKGIFEYLRLCEEWRDKGFERDLIVTH